VIDRVNVKNMMYEAIHEWCEICLDMYLMWSMGW